MFTRRLFSVGRQLVSSNVLNTFQSNFQFISCFNKSIIRFWHKHNLLKCLQFKNESSVDPSFVPRNTFLQKPNKIEFIKSPTVEQKTCQSIIKNVNQLVKQQAEGRLFAVIQVMGKQYKVTDGDIIVLEGYWAPTTGDKLRMEKVQMRNSNRCWQIK